MAGVTHIASTNRKASITRAAVRNRAGSVFYPSNIAGFNVSPIAVDANIRSLILQLPFVESVANSFTSATLRFKRQVDIDWQGGQAPDILRPASATAAYGAVVDLAPATAYDIEIVVTDAVGATQVLAVVGTTKADPYTAPNTLVATHYVRADGSDNNAGTADTAGGAWATVGKAISSATSGAVVLVDEGVWEVTPAASLTNTTGMRLGPITFMARNQPINDVGVRINSGHETFFITSIRTSPTGSGKKNAGAWEQITLTGPGNDGNAVTTYTVWKWAGGQLGGDAVRRCAYGASETGQLTSLAPWKDDASHLATPSGWVEKMYTNQSYTYGWYETQQSSVDDNAPTGVYAAGDIFVRLPGDVDPNTLYLQFGNRGAAIGLRGADSRVSGIVFCGFRYCIQTYLSTAPRHIFDHCAVMNGAEFHYNSGAPLGQTFPRTGGDIIHRYHVLTERGLRAPSGGTPDSSLVPWQLIKGAIINADGSTYGTTKISDRLEDHAFSGRNGLGGMEIGYCIVDGYQNGVSPGGEDAEPSGNRYQGLHYDVHHSTFKNIQDDALEPELEQIGFLAWDCSFEYVLDVLSVGPVHYGPAWMWRCRVWRFGPKGLPTTGSWGGSGAPGGVGIKYGGNSSPRAIVRLFHCIFWTDDPGLAAAGVSGGADAVGSSTSDEGLVMLNCVFRATRYAYVWPRSRAVGIPAVWEDYNLWATSDATRGLQPGSNNNVQTTIAGWRSATGQGAHSNKISGVDQSLTSVTWLDALLTDPTNGDLTFLSPLDGVNVGGISDNLGRTARIGYVP